MTEASYTAWDDKQYVWPPPEGWYQAADEKWWPEGYGPPEAEAAADVVDAVDASEPDGHDLSAGAGAGAAAAAATMAFGDEAANGAGAVVSEASETVSGFMPDVASAASETAVMSSDGPGIGGAIDNAVGSASDSLGGLADAPSSLGDAAEGLTDGASDSFGGLADRASGLTDGAADAASGLTDRASGIADGASGIADGASGLADGASGLADGAADAASGLTDRAADLPGDLSGDALGDAAENLSISDVDGFPTADIGTMDDQLGGLTERVSDLGDLPSPDLGDLPSPGLADLPAPDLGDLPAPDLAGVASSVGDALPDAPGDLGGLGDLGDAASSLGGDDIPSIRDLASPDMDLSDLPAGDMLDQDATQVVPTDLVGQFSDPLPPPPGGPSVDAPSFDAPNVDAPSIDAPNADLPPIDGPNADSSLFDAPTIGAPSAGAASFDAPTIDAPSAGVPGFDAPPQGLGDVAMAPPSQAPPPGQAPPQYSAPGVGGQPGSPSGSLQQEILSSNKGGGGRSKTLIFVLLGVLLLAAIGAALYWQFGRDSGDADASAVVTTGPGSVNEPHPRSTGVVVFYPDGDTDQRWVIQVLAPVAIGTGDLASGAADGNVYAVTQVQVRNESGSEGALLSDLRFNAVNAAGDLIDREAEPCPATADDLVYDAAVGVGSEVVGAVCWSIPASDLDGLKLGLESEKVAGRVHISLQ